MAQGSMAHLLKAVRIGKSAFGLAFAGCFVVLTGSAQAGAPVFQQRRYHPVALQEPVTAMMIAGHAIKILSGVRKTDGASGGPVTAVLALDPEGAWQWVETEQPDTPSSSKGLRQGPELLALDHPHTGEDSVTAYRYYASDDSTHFVRVKAHRLIRDDYLKPAPVLVRVDELIWDESFGLFRFRISSSTRIKRFYQSVDQFFEREGSTLALP